MVQHDRLRELALPSLCLARDRVPSRGNLRVAGVSAMSSRERRIYNALPLGMRSLYIAYLDLRDLTRLMRGRID